MANINWKLVSKWRDELRSGKWEQTKHMLQNENGAMCCLGVLEDKVCKTPKRLVPDTGKYKFIGGNLGYETVELTRSTANRLGVTSQLPTIFNRTLSSLNDNDGLTFDEIADLLDIALIEKDYLS